MRKALTNSRSRRRAGGRPAVGGRRGAVDGDDREELALREEVVGLEEAADVRTGTVLPGLASCTSAGRTSRRARTGASWRKTVAM